MQKMYEILAVLFMVVIFAGAVCDLIVANNEDSDNV
jgi:hypothetical protein